MRPIRRSRKMVEQLLRLNACDGYVALVVDPVTKEIDAYGPLEGPDAVLHAGRLRAELDETGLPEVHVRLCRLHLLDEGAPVVEPGADTPGGRHRRDRRRWQP